MPAALRVLMEKDYGCDDAQSFETSDRVARLERLQDNAGPACDLLKCMAHESRLIILCLLSVRERSVMELEESLALRQPAVSQQLARLRSDNLVSTRRDGKMIYYSLASAKALAIVELLTDLFGMKDRSETLQRDPVTIDQGAGAIDGA